jgi:hypothetical protein
MTLDCLLGVAMLMWASCKRDAACAGELVLVAGRDSPPLGATSDLHAREVKPSALQLSVTRNSLYLALMIC